MGEWMDFTSSEYAPPILIIATVGDNPFNNVKLSAHY